MNVKTIYCFNGGKSGFGDDLLAVALCQDGHGLAGHVCSSEGFMQHDLGITSDWKHKRYDEHCGEGNWRLEWVPTDQIETHEGLQAALKLNDELERSEA